MSLTRTLTVSLSPSEQKHLLGEYNSHLKYLQDRLNINILQRGEQFTLTGELTAVTRGEYVLTHLAELAKEEAVSGEQLHLLIQASATNNLSLIHI